MSNSFSAGTVRTQKWIDIITVYNKCFKATVSKSYYHFHPFKRVTCKAETSPLLIWRKYLRNIQHGKYQIYLKWRWKIGCFPPELTNTVLWFPITPSLSKYLNIFKNCPVGLPHLLAPKELPTTIPSQFSNIQSNTAQILSPELTWRGLRPRKKVKTNTKTPNFTYINLYFQWQLCQQCCYSVPVSQASLPAVPEKHNIRNTGSRNTK